ERHGLDRAAAAQVLYAARRDSDALRRGARPPEDAPCLFAPSIRLLAQERRDLGCVERRRRRGRMRMLPAAAHDGRRVVVLVIRIAVVIVTRADGVVGA